MSLKLRSFGRGAILATVLCLSTLWMMTSIGEFLIFGSKLSLLSNLVELASVLLPCLVFYGVKKPTEAVVLVWVYFVFAFVECGLSTKQVDFLTCMRTLYLLVMTTLLFTAVPFFSQKSTENTAAQ